MNDRRRGACPGILHPMPTGDGLLARLAPPGPLALETMIALCAAGRTHGNGIVEITQRGSLQFRGLSPASATDFAQAVEALGLGTESRPPVLTSSLMGIDARGGVDLREMLAALRTALTTPPAPGALAPKMSVLVDGGGALHLDDVSGDLRLRAGADGRVHLSIGGTAARSMSLGWLPAHRAPSVVVRLLARIAQEGPTARAGDFANPQGVRVLATLLMDVFDDAAGANVPDEAPPALRPAAQPIGIHPLRTGQVALGVAPAFGHTTAAALESWLRQAAAAGASSMETCRGHALLIIGLNASAVPDLAARASDHGFIIRADDPRRFVAACPGAPACSSAAMAARELAPAIAAAAPSFLDGSLTIHVSGCPKGCAHPDAAALTFIGPSHLVVEGRAGDTADGTMAIGEFIAGLSRLNTARGRGAPVERSADTVSRLGVPGVLAAMRGGQ